MVNLDKSLNYLLDFLQEQVKQALKNKKKKQKEQKEQKAAAEKEEAKKITKKKSVRFA